jgi:hypothetical protein
MQSDLSLVPTSPSIMKAISLVNVEKHQVRSKTVWTLAASPLLATKDEYPEDAATIRRLQVLGEERS